MSGFDTAGLLESLLRLLPNSFAQASLMAKFVMGLLAFASLWSWVLICEGLFALSKLKRALKQASQGITSRVVEPVIAAGLSASRRVISGESSGELRQRIVEAMSRRAQNLLSDAEGGLPNLAVIASVAPFIGLFGTVYGIMTSFANIAEAKDTSLAVVAPGIAEALAATAMGLAAAIPASIAYNRLGAALSRAGQRLGHVIEEQAVEIAAGEKPTALKVVA